jgi:hypothetical protein
MKRKTNNHLIPFCYDTNDVGTYEALQYRTE